MFWFRSFYFNFYWTFLFWCLILKFGRSNPMRVICILCWIGLSDPSTGTQALTYRCAPLLSSAPWLGLGMCCPSKFFNFSAGLGISLVGFCHPPCPFVTPLDLSRLLDWYGWREITSNHHDLKWRHEWSDFRLVGGEALHSVVQLFPLGASPCFFSYFIGRGKRPHKGTV